jgi:hypothetical protein
MPSPSSRPRAGALLLGALAALLLAVLPSAATAAPVVYSAPGGAEITLDPGAVVAGGRIQVSGTGFTGLGGAGQPLVAIKPDDLDLPWAYGGPSAYAGPDDAPIWFEVAGDGTFGGWIDVPAGLAPTAPGGGRHWLRLLSGAFSTGSNVTTPISVQAHFTLADRVTLGATNVSGTFYKGSTFQAGAAGAITPQGLGFTPGTAVDVALDGAPLAGASITTDAGGDFPAAARLTIPGATATGPHTLTFATGAVTATVPVTVTGAPAATLDTPAVRPGGRVAVTLDGFVGIAGTGQKVALKLEPEPVGACVTTTVDGDGVASAGVPASLAPGTYTLRVLAGTSCVAGGTQDDLPGRMVPLSVTVDAAAPAATVPAKGSIGGAIAVTGSGFGASEAVTARLDGVATGATITTKPDGTLSASVLVPAGTAPGTHLVTLRSATGGAAATFAAVPAPAGAVTRAKVTAGGELAFTFSGFVLGDGSGGQKVAVKVDSGDTLACVQADAGGDGAGTITVPAATTLGAHTLRLLAGTACVQGGGVAEAPGRSVGVALTVVAADAPAGGGGTGAAGTPAPAPVLLPPGTPAGPPPPATVVPTAPKPRTAKLKDGKLVLTLAGGTAQRVAVTVTTPGRVRLTRTGRAKVVTLARATVTRAGTVRLALTRDGKALLKRKGKMKVKVRIAPSAGGGPAVTTTLTLVRA